MLLCKLTLYFLFIFYLVFWAHERIKMRNWTGKSRITTFYCATLHLRLRCLVCLLLIFFYFSLWLFCSYFWFVFLLHNFLWLCLEFFNDRVGWIRLEFISFILVTNVCPIAQSEKNVYWIIFFFFLWNGK